MESSCCWGSLAKRRLPSITVQPGQRASEREEGGRHSRGLCRKSMQERTPCEQKLDCGYGSFQFLRRQASARGGPEAAGPKFLKPAWKGGEGSIKLR